MTLTVTLQGQRGELAMDMQFSVPATGITGVFGRSGAGKSSLLRWLAGLENDLDGELQLNGEWLDGVPAHHRRVGLVFQQGALFPHLDVAGNLAFARRFSGATDSEAKQISSLLGLAPLMDYRPAQLSGGQQQRVALGRALLGKPRLLLLDEPLASLDQDSRQEVLQVLETLHREWRTPMLYVSHQASEIQRLADHLLLVDQGRITASGALADCLLDPALPLAHQPDAAAIIEARAVDAGEPEQTRLTFDGGELVLPGEVATTAPVRISILARDVSLALSRATDSSISNILPAVVVDLHSHHSEGHRLVRVKVGNALLLARLTLASCQRLDIRPGQKLFAQVKSVALLGPAG